MNFKKFIKDLFLLTVFVSFFVFSIMLRISFSADAAFKNESVQKSEKLLLENGFKSEVNETEMFDKPDKIDMDSEKNLIEDSSIIDVQINSDDKMEFSTNDIQGNMLSTDLTELKKIEENEVGIKSRETLKRLELPTDLQVLKKKQRLQPLSIAEADQSRLKLQTNNFLILKNRSIDKVDNPLSRKNEYFSRNLSNEIKNIRQVKTNVRKTEIVSMSNSGKMVLRERVGREEFKKRQERFESKNKTSESISSEPYLPDGQLISIPEISIPNLPGGN